jgi:tRNA(Ile2) C34 agmatinyltransferase TiaS
MSDERPTCVECGGRARWGGLRCQDCYEAAVYAEGFR